MAQKEYCFPIGAFGAHRAATASPTARENMKRYNPINISGYHISEAGALAAATKWRSRCATCIAYVEEVLKTGMDVDEFAPRLAFFFVCQADFFEEIAKFRAVRRVYAKIMKERFGAKNPDSMRLRFHCQTAAATLTKPQYQINVVRTALQALAAVLGGARSCTPTAMTRRSRSRPKTRCAWRCARSRSSPRRSTSPSVVDPLGGSYFVESLTTNTRSESSRFSTMSTHNGGTIKLIEDGWFQKQIADFAYETALRKQSGEKPVIGVNRFIDEEEVHDIETASLRSADRRAADRAHQARSRRAGRRQGTRAASKSSSRWPRTTGRTSCRSPSRRSRTARPWARSSTP